MLIPLFAQFLLVNSINQTLPLITTLTGVSAFWRRLPYMTILIYISFIDQVGMSLLIQSITL